MIVDAVIDTITKLIPMVFRVRRAHNAIAGLVWEGDVIAQNFSRDRVNTACWYGVVGERLRGKRVFDCGCTEVAGALVRGQNYSRVRGSLRVAESFVVAEDEQPVFHDRATEGAAILVLLQGWSEGGEKILRLKGIVAIKLPGAAVPGVAAGLSHNIHHRSRVSPVLGAIGMCHDLKFLDGIRRRPHHESA